MPPSFSPKENVPELLRQAVALRAQGQTDAAIALLQRAVAAAPGEAEPHHQLGNALKAQRRHAEARVSLTRARELAPNEGAIRLNLGATLLALEARAEAIVEFEAAIAREPERAEAHNILGCALLAEGRIGEAVSRFRTALRIKPTYPAAHDNLGRALRAQGRAREALAEFRAALASGPSPGTHSNLVYALNFVPGLPPGEIATEHRQWAALHAPRGAVHTLAADRDRSPTRRLRIGYLSPDFVHHAVSYFISPVLAAHRRSEVEIFCYANVAVSDRVTGRLRGLSDHWRDIAPLTDDQAADLIRRDRIDLLVDLAGHTAGNRLPVFAQQPAPIQLTWLGYPNTTGVAAIGYRITDDISDPPGSTEQFHSERLVRLPGPFCCYQPSADAPPVAASPAATRGQITFGSCNHFAKLNAGVIDLWARLLASIPDSRMLIKAHSLADPTTAADLRAAFARHGVQPNRLELRSDRLSVADHLAWYNEVDVALDPFPYNGTTTTCEALWMGVPVVTLAGSTHVARVTASLLTHLGKSEWIASSEADYLAIGARLAADRAGLARERAGQRERMRASPLCDAAEFIAGLETLYRSLWTDWLQSTAPARS